MLPLVYRKGYRVLFSMFIVVDVNGRKSSVWLCRKEKETLNRHLIRQPASLQIVTADSPDHNKSLHKNTHMDKRILEQILLATFVNDLVGLLWSGMYSARLITVPEYPQMERTNSGDKYNENECFVGRNQYRTVQFSEKLGKFVEREFRCFCFTTTNLQADFAIGNHHLIPKMGDQP